MISKKTCSILYFSRLFNVQMIYMIVTINMVQHSILCQAKSVTGDSQSKRDLSTAVSVSGTNCDRFSIPHNNQFFSPGYPNTYPSNADCYLMIEADPGMLIKLDFRNKFHIEGGDNCPHDFLEIRDGPYGYNKELGGKYCGTTFPPLLMSTGRFMWLHFKSDDTIEYEGFQAVYEFVPRSRSIHIPESLNCTMGFFNLEEGLIDTTSNISHEVLSFSAKYNVPVDCLWKIVVREGWKIQLQFEDFILDKANDCDTNYVEIFSDGTDMPSLEKKFCGSMADTVTSKHHIMYVRYFIEQLSNKTRIRANFTAFREYQKDAAIQCGPDEFNCEDSTCIASSLKCNGLYNCRFRWDEDNCEGELGTKALSLKDDQIVIIMSIFSLILSGMCITFFYNCIKKLLRDHRTIQDYIRQSREQQLNELDKQSQAADKQLSKVSGSHSRSNSSPSIDSHNTATTMNHHHHNNHNHHHHQTTPCYVPGGELLPILLRHDSSSNNNNKNDTTAAMPSDNPDDAIYTVDNNDMMMPEMCDTACQTRESLFTTQAYSSSGNSTPVHNASPPAPFSTFGYKKPRQRGGDTISNSSSKFKAEAMIEVADRGLPPPPPPSSSVALHHHHHHHQNKVYIGDGGGGSASRRPYSVQSTKSAPDVIVTH